MPISITLERDQGDAAVSQACSSHQPAELRYGSSQNTEGPLQTVMLDVNASSLLIEAPAGPDGVPEPAEGDEVRITFNAGGRRFGLDTLVRGRRNWHVDPGTPIAAIELKRPQRVFELQRRADYRVPLWGAAPVTAHFELLPLGDAEDAAMVESFHAEIQNISAGGIAALVSPSERACILVGQHYMMEFFLPGCDEPFTFAVKIQHLRQLRHGEVRLMGLKFMPGDDSESGRRAIREVRSYVEVHRRVKV